MVSMTNEFSSGGKLTIQDAAFEAAMKSFVEGMAIVLRATQMVASHDAHQAANMLGVELTDIRVLASMSENQIFNTAEKIDTISIGTGNSITLGDLSGFANRQHLIMRRLQIMGTRLDPEMCVSVD